MPKPPSPHSISAYPTGTYTSGGLNLLFLTEDKSRHVPRVIDLSRLMIDGMVMPISRSLQETHKSVRRTMELAEKFSIPLIFLCSGVCNKSDLATIGREFKNLEWVGIDGPFTTEMQGVTFGTESSELAWGSERDQGIKRNLGLKIAKMMNWKVVVFIDDDITLLENHLLRISDIMTQGEASVVGFNARFYPDNSIVCAASKISGSAIDAFVSSQILAVRVDQPECSFFPHIYNEDWLFMLPYILGGKKLVWAGEVEQKPYNPFNSLSRPFLEESGDLIAEGLFRLALEKKSLRTTSNDPHKQIVSILRQSTASFWQSEIIRRAAFISETKRRIYQSNQTRRMRNQIIKALDSSIEVLCGGSSEILSPDALQNWVELWTKDLTTWNKYLLELKSCNSIVEAVTQLGISDNLLYHQPDLKNSRTSMPKSTLRPISSITRRREIGVSNTAAVEQYLGGNSTALIEIAKSADFIRFDRPLTSPIDEKPLVSINMFIQNGESIDVVSGSIRNLVKWNTNNAPIDCILWVLGSDNNHEEDVKSYREYLVSSVVTIVIGSNVRIRSAIIIPQRFGVDELISTALDKLIPAYWKCDVAVDKQVVITNSRLDILRHGYFWDFVNRECTISSITMKRFIGEIRGSHTLNAFSVESDNQAINKARAQLQQLHYPTVITPMRPTEMLIKIMSKARISWAAMDNMHYDLRVHHKRGNAALAAINKIVYIRISATTPIDKIIKDLIVVTNTYRTKQLAIGVVIDSNNEPLQNAMILRDALQKRTLKMPQLAKTLLMTYILVSSGSGIKNEKHRLKALFTYVYWTENHRQYISVTNVDTGSFFGVYKLQRIFRRVREIF